jgi:hypothetical protein
MIALFWLFLTLYQTNRGHREIDVDDLKRDLGRAKRTCPPSCLLALRSDGTKCLRRKFRS